MNNQQQPQRQGAIIGGVILLGIGIVWMLSAMGITLPFFIYKPYFWIIGLGIFLGYRKNFNAPYTWMIPLAIGVLSLMKEELNIDFEKFGIPAILITIGGYIIFNGLSKKNKKTELNNNEENIYNTSQKNSGQTSTASDNTTEQINNSSTQYSETTANTQYNYSYNYSHSTNINKLDVTAFMSGAKRNIVSKNFAGGDVLAMMGGADINLLQADMQSPAVIDVTAIMGGIKLIVPADWQIQNQVTGILGGVEERRQLMNTPEDSKKILVIKGIALMGGVEIRSY
jgi:predicted membrane protein